MAAIFTASGTSAGVGFAIGIDTVRKVVPQLLETGRVLRPALNIQVGIFARKPVTVAPFEASHCIAPLDRMRRQDP
jgi:S1-C subfamily serine protease